MAFIQFFVVLAFVFSIVFAPERPVAMDCGTNGADSCRAEPAVELPDPATAAEGWLPLETKGVFGVIVATDDASTLYPNADDYWTPGQTDVELAEAAVFDDQGGLDHFRQYVGVVEDGEQKVSINGFCDSWGLNWYAQPVQVDDGGDCYFSALYNVEDGELEYFSFNGEG